MAESRRIPRTKTTVRFEMAAPAFQKFDAKQFDLFMGKDIHLQWGMNVYEGKLLEATVFNDGSVVHLLVQLTNTQDIRIAL